MGVDDAMEFLDVLIGTFQWVKMYACMHKSRPLIRSAFKSNCYKCMALLKTYNTSR